MNIQIVLDCPKCHWDMNLEEETEENQLWIYKCEKCNTMVVQDLIKAEYNTWFTI